MRCGDAVRDAELNSNSNSSREMLDTRIIDSVLLVKNKARYLRCCSALTPRPKIEKKTPLSPASVEHQPNTGNPQRQLTRNT